METDSGVPVASPRAERNPHSRQKWKVLQNLFIRVNVIRRFGNKYYSKSFQSYLADVIQARSVFHSPGNSEFPGEPAQAIMDNSAASLRSQREVPSSLSLPFVGLQGMGGMGKSTLGNEVKRTFLKKHDEDFIITKNEVLAFMSRESAIINGESAIINGECGIEAMQDHNGIVQMDADSETEEFVRFPTDEVKTTFLYDESDSEIEEFDIPSEDESAASRESQAEVTSDSHVPQIEPSQNAGRKTSVVSAFGEYDLITRLGSFVKKQIEVALQPLMCALQRRDEDKQRHREMMLAIEAEKLALIRQKMVYSRILAQSNALPARLPQIHPQNCPIPDLNTEMPVPHIDVKGEDMAKWEAHGKATLERDINRLKLSVEEPPPVMKLPTPLNHEHLFTIEPPEIKVLKLRLAGGRTKDDMHSLINESGARQTENLGLNEKLGMWEHSSKYRTFGRSSPWRSCYSPRSTWRDRLLETAASDSFTMAVTYYYGDQRMYPDYSSLDDLFYPDEHYFQKVRKEAEVQAKAIKKKEAEEKGRGKVRGGGGGGGKKGDGEEKKDGDKEGEGEKIKQPKVVELKVSLCCDSCVRTLKRKLSTLDEVESVVCDLYENKVIVIAAADTKPETVLKRAQKVKKTAVMWPKKETEKESGDKKESDHKKKY